MSYESRPGKPEQTTTPDPAPADEADTVPWLKRECDQLGNAVLAAEYEKEALSGLLRGMARRAAFWRRQNTAWIRQAIRADGEASELRAELARVRPVVDAAIAWYEGWAPSSILHDEVAALDGDAAATPQPAAEHVWPGYEHLADLHEQLTDVISDHYPTPDHVDAQTPAGTLAALLMPSIHAKVIGLVAAEVNAWQAKIREEDAARSSTPPLDVPAGLRAAAKVLDEGDVYLGVTREANALRRLADTIEADPSDTTSQAIVRALATPTADTPGGDR